MANSFLGSEEGQGIIDLAYNKIRDDRARKPKAEVCLEQQNSRLSTDADHQQ